MLLVEEYLNDLLATGKSPATIDTYRRQLRGFATWLEDNSGSTDPREITSIDAVEYRQYLQDKGFKPSSINTALAAIEAFCIWLANEGQINHNPLAKVKRVEQVQEPPKWLGKNEKYRVIRTLFGIKDIRNRAIVLTMLMAGLRVSELINLKPDDITVGDKKGSVVIQSGKGNKRRTVPIPKELREVLGEYLEKRITAPWLFPSQRGEKLTVRAVQHLCAAIGDKAGIEKLTPHMLRHTFCHDLVSKGVDLGTVAKLAGHSKIDTTLIYTQPGQAELQAAVETLNFT